LAGKNVLGTSDNGFYVNMQARNMPAIPSAENAPELPEDCRFWLDYQKIDTQPVKIEPIFPPPCVKNVALYCCIIFEQLPV